MSQPLPPAPVFAGTTDNERMDSVEQYVNLDKFEGLAPTQRIAEAEKSTHTLVNFYKERAANFAGFQINQQEKYSDRLAPVLDMHINNIGDPYADNGGFRLNSKAAERAVLRHYSTLFIGEPTEDYSIPQPSDPKAVAYSPTMEMGEKFFSTAAGYVMSCGSTEGNLWSLRQGRDYLLGKFLFSALYGTTEGHFGPLAKQHKSVHFKRHHHSDPIGISLPSSVLKSDHKKVSIAHHAKALKKGTPRYKHQVEFETPVKPLLPNPEMCTHLAFRQPIILYSTASHYSISKIKDLLEIETPNSFMISFAGASVKPSDCFAELQKQPNLSKADRELTPEKYIEVFGRDSFPDCLPAHEDGTMNLLALRFMVRLFFSLGNPVLVVANLGSTFTGVHDDPQAFSHVILETPGCHLEGHHEEIVDGVEHTIITRRNYYIHVDGALGASYVPYFEKHTKDATTKKLNQLLKDHCQDPFVQSYLLRLKTQGDIMARVEKGDYNYATELANKHQQEEKHQAPLVTADEAKKNALIDFGAIILPTFNLRECPAVMSVAMSGHKFLGCPVPSGLAMSIRRYQLDYLTSGISYINSPDTTISGSRSGLNVQVFHDYLSRFSHEMTVLKYWVGYNSARFTAKLAAHSIKSSALFVARDKYESPSKMTPFEKVLFADQEKQFKEPENGRKAPLIFNFPGSLSVIVPEPSYNIQDKYSLSLDIVHLDGKLYKFDEDYLKISPILTFNSKSNSYTLKCAHVFAMDSLSTELIQNFCHDLQNDPRLQALVNAQHLVKSE